MSRLLVLACLLGGCITDDGKIDDVCDEISLPCYWESDENQEFDDSGQDDTGR